MNGVFRIIFFFLLLECNRYFFVYANSDRYNPQFTSFPEFNQRFSRRRPIIERGSCRAFKRKRSYSGNCNSFYQPENGRTATPLVVITKVVDYKKVKSRNARYVSNVVCREESSPGNRRRLSELVTIFGQFVDHTITETENSKDSWPIEIPRNDPTYKAGRRIEFFRSIKQSDADGVYESPVNQLSSFLDLASIYGKNERDALALRTGRHGQLQNSEGNHLAKDSRGFYKSGDNRVNENPNLISIHTLFNREHNLVCKEIIEVFPHRTDDDEWVYQLARKIVIAEFQAIVYHEFLPAVLGDFPAYSGYKRDVNPGVSNEFSSCAFRVGHTMINPQFNFVTEDGAQKKMKLRDVFFKPRVFQDIGMDAIIRGQMLNLASEIDAGITSEVRDFLFAGGHVILDLAALNIQRGRDNGIPRYNELRKLYGLREATSMADVSSNWNVQNKLTRAYEIVEYVDAWVGGLCEDHVEGSSLGELFYTIWKREFQRIRDGDRFYFEQQQHFKSRHVSEIRALRELMRDRDGKQTTLHRLISRNTGIPKEEISRKPFFV